MLISAKINFKDKISRIIYDNKIAFIRTHISLEKDFGEVEFFILKNTFNKEETMSLLDKEIESIDIIELGKTIYSIIVQSDNIKNIVFDTTGQMFKQFTNSKDLTLMIIRGNINVIGRETNDLITNADMICTTLCNMNCEYCEQPHKKNIIDFDKIKSKYDSVIEHLKVSANNDLFHASIIGGELSADIESMEKFVEKLKRNNILTDNTTMVKVFTNARVFNPKFADILKTVPNFELMISVSSVNVHCDARHTVSSKMIEVVKKYREILGDNKINIVIVVDENALNTLKETVEFFYSNNFKRFLIKLENSFASYLKTDEIKLNEYFRKLNNLYIEFEDIFMMTRVDLAPEHFINYYIDDEISDKEDKRFPIAEICYGVPFYKEHITAFGPEEKFYINKNKDKTFGVFTRKMLGDYIENA